MSSKDFQVTQRTQRVMKTSPKKNVKQIYKNQANLKKVDSTSKRSPLEIQTAQPASTFVSRRELNLNSLTDARDQNQLPVRAKNNASGRVKITNGKKTFKYEYKSKNNPKQNSRINKIREISSVGKKGNQRFKSYEQQSMFPRRYETSESPLKRRGGPLAFGRGNNINMKKWGYASKKEINKIIVLQRWWRYLLKKSKNKRNKFQKSMDKSLKYRSKSSNVQKTVDLSTFMKQAESITEKIFPGKNNKLIIETRKVEVFKINRPKRKKEIQVGSKETQQLSENISYSEKLEERKDKQKFNKDKYNTIDAERRKREIIKIKGEKAKIKGEMTYDSKEKARYGGETSQDSKKYGKIKKEGENITDKIYPGKNGTLINERRKVEVFKLDKTKAKQDLKVPSKESGRYGETSQDSKKYGKIKKEGENITDKIYPGKNDTLINERRKVEEFKLDKAKTKQDFRKSSQESGRHATSSKDSKKYGDITKEGESITDKIYPGKNDTLINERRKVEVYKINKSKSKQDISGSSIEKGEYKYSSKDKNQIQISQIKKGEKIIDKSYPEKDETLNKEKKKNEGFKFKKPRAKEGTKEASKYSQSLKQLTKDEKDFSKIEKQGENITEKVFPGLNDSLIIETRKVEVFKNKAKKKKKEGVKEPKTYTDTAKESEKYEEEDQEHAGKFNISIKKTSQTIDLEKDKKLVKEPRKRGQKGKKGKNFFEENGITKKFIKEKMKEIWLDESIKSSVNRLTFFGTKQNKNIIERAGTRDSSSDTRGVPTDNNKINNLMNMIKEKDIELNKIVNQLKSQLNTRNKTYDTRTAGKAFQQIFMI